MPVLTRSCWQGNTRYAFVAVFPAPKTIRNEGPARSLDCVKYLTAVDAMVTMTPSVSCCNMTVKHYSPPPPSPPPPSIHKARKPSSSILRSLWSMERWICSRSVSSLVALLVIRLPAQDSASVGDESTLQLHVVDSWPNNRIQSVCTFAGATEVDP